MKHTATKTLLATVVTAALLLGTATAQNHYPAGTEGIKAATLPPPGIYFRDYNFYYWANELPGGPPNFKVSAYINAPRDIWMTDLTLLGANYGMDVIVPFGYSKVRAGATSSDFGLGDIQIEPVLLGWHKAQWDFALAYSVWAPTGSSGSPSDIGKGFWSHMFTAGATWYPDTNKLWSASALSRYEIHTKSDDVPVTPGDTFTLEVGLGKTLQPGMDLGLVGYWQEQVANGKNDPTRDERVFGVGPEITAVWPKLKTQFSLRYLREFGAKERPEGNTLTLTATRRF